MRRLLAALLLFLAPSIASVALAQPTALPQGHPSLDGPPVPASDPRQGAAIGHCPYNARED